MTALVSAAEYTACPVAPAAAVSSLATDCLARNLERPGALWLEVLP